MLYKKYHRNFVRKFKRGIKLSISTSVEDSVKDETLSEPFIDIDYGEICIRSRSFYEWTLVYYCGRINYNMKIKEDVV